MPRGQYAHGIKPDRGGKESPRCVEESIDWRGFVPRLCPRNRWSRGPGRAYTERVIHTHDRAMTRHTLPCLLGLSLLFATCAQAHDPLAKNKNWCLDPNTSPKIVSSFSLSPLALAQYRSEHAPLLGESGASYCVPEKTCGIVDEWYWANQAAHDQCSALGVKSTDASGQQPVPFVQSPADFDPDNGSHHDLYRFKDDNLQGVCVVCVDNRVEAEPLLPDR